MSDVTQILSAIEHGAPHAADELFPLVYDELRQLAAEKMSHERPEHTLQATALVHEAYVRRVDVEQTQHWQSRAHFFSAAAEAMRRILIEAARRKGRLKRGGDRARDGNLTEIASAQRPESLLALDKALDKLSVANPQAAELVKLRYFAGFSNREAAALLGISPRQANNVWAYARAWLLEELADSD